MELIFKYVAFICVAINLINWAVAARHAEAAGVPEAKLVRAHQVIRAFFGGGALWFVLLGTLQLEGGYPTPLFFLRWPPAGWQGVVAWVSIYASWGLLLHGIWSTDAIEVMLELKMMQNPLGLEARPLRLFYSVLIVIGMIVVPLIAYWVPQVPGVR